MRTVAHVRIGQVVYGGQDGVYDPEADVWRYPLSIDLLPIVEEDNVTREATAEELRAIERSAVLNVRVLVEVPAGPDGAEPVTEAILAVVAQTLVASTTAARTAVVGEEIVLAYLRSVE